MTIDDKWSYEKLLSNSDTASQRCHYMGKSRRPKVFGDDELVAL